MRRLRQIAILIVMTMSQLLLHGQTQTWRCVRNTNGVEVYSKKSTETGIRIIRIDTRIKTTLSALVSVIKDTQNHKNWVFFNKSARFLQSTDPFHWIYYAQSDAPWPVVDRDLVVRGTLKQDPNTHEIEIDANTIPDFIPSKQGFIRIPYSKSKWILSPEPNGWVRVQFEVEINLGGAIPKWLSNLTAAKGPCESIIAFRKQLEKEKYKNAHLPYIQEP